MKKNILFAMMMVFLMASILITSCSKDETPSLIIQLDKTNVSLSVGESYSLNVSVENGNVDQNFLKWESSNSDVVEVNDGEIKALSVGEATISISYDSKIYATCLVVVSAIDVTSIKLNQHEISLSLNESFQLTVDIIPSNATYQEIIWESSDENIAIVSAEGLVESKNIGNVTIRAISANSSVYDECIVTVRPQEVTGITCQENAMILLGQSIKLEAEVLPTDATNKSIIWLSSNPEIATVDENGIVNGIRYGNAIITAKSDENGYEAQCNVDVCAIDRFVTVTANAGTEGSTSSGFNSYLRLKFNTNVDSQVFIESILLNDEYGSTKGFEEPNILCSEYSTKFVTQYHGSSSLNTFSAEGWKFLITYTWNDTQYVVNYTDTKKVGWL